MDRGPEDVPDTVTAELRAAVRVAGLTADQFARTREQALRRQLDEWQRAELHARVDQDHRADRHQMALADHPQFWERATPQEIGRTYGAARAWADRDLEARRVADQLRGQLRSRYGIDPEAEVQRGLAREERADARRAEAEAGGAEQRAEQAWSEATTGGWHPDGRDAPGADPGVAEVGVPGGVDDAGVPTGHPEAAGPEAWVSTREDAGPEPGAAGSGAGGRDADPVAASRAEVEDDRAREARADGVRSYDSAERRDATAAALEARGIDPRTVATRMRADVSQARPATEATRIPGRARTAAARAGRVRGVRRQTAPER
ncbi:hypothetical protein DT076_07945 [Desertihabitans brevis]|uniref:Uncharacterized protein n=1 Tax=Desertihabitans brevis TaxID=2268447 RepID=A0A367YWP4_9ACTN|nr:hypothetical protein [Desertihabitans brevis]RCK69939.1 hypothetical protein DT076_07945 [Desertihabitans brevis]